MPSKFLMSICAATSLLPILTGCTESNGDSPIAQQSVSIEPESHEQQTNHEELSGNTTLDQNQSNAAAAKNSEAKVALIPDKFPDDIFISENPTDVQFTESGGKMNLTLLFAGSEADTLVKSFQQGMADQGWAEVTSSKLPLGTITNFTKEDRKCTISIGPVPGKDLLRVAIML